jgi:hypothetical protein
MRRLFYVCALLFILNNSIAGTTGRVPESVKSYIKVNFPKAKQLNWEKHEDMYIAHFVNENQEMYVCLNNKGEVLDKLVELKLNEVPPAIQSQIGAPLEFAERFEGRNGELFYICEVKLPKGRSKEMIFDKEGKEVNEIVLDNSKNNGDSVLEF